MQWMLTRGFHRSVSIHRTAIPPACGFRGVNTPRTTAPAPSFFVHFLPSPLCPALSPSLRPSIFSSPALLSLTFPSLLCREAPPPNPAKGCVGARVESRLQKHFEPRKHVWWKRFWFFFVLNKHKFSLDVLKMSPSSYTLRGPRVVHYGRATMKGRPPFRVGIGPPEGLIWH